jgi:hypothetical protein
MRVEEEDEWLVQTTKAEGGLKGDSEDQPQWRSSPWLVSWPVPPQQPVWPLFP